MNDTYCTEDSSAESGCSTNGLNGHHHPNHYTKGLQNVMNVMSSMNGLGRLQRAGTGGTESSSSSSCGDRDWNCNFELENTLEDVVDNVGLGSADEDANRNLIQEAMASRRIGDYPYASYSQFNMCYDEPRSLILQMSGMLKQKRDCLTERGQSEEPVLLHFLVTVGVSGSKRSHVASLFLINDLKDPKKLVAHVQVPSSDYAAEIVGKGGEKVKAMRHEFGVYIKSPARTETPSLFMLSGPCENVVSCVAHLTKCVEHFYQIRRKGLAKTGTESSFPLSDPGSVDERFPPPRFRSERRAQTELPSQSIGVNSSSTYNSIMNNTATAAAAGVPGARYAPVTKRTATLQVEKDLVGLLVGPHGATILSIKSKINESLMAAAAASGAVTNPNIVQADIMTPKMGAESCFTITGTPEQIKLAKEVMCIYIVERDPSRAWPDPTVFYSPEAKTIVEAIIEEQKQRERGGGPGPGSTGKTRNGSGGGGGMGSPLLPGMLSRLGLAGLSNGLSNAARMNLQSVLSQPAASAYSHSEDDTAGSSLADSLGQDGMSNLASWWNNSSLGFLGIDEYSRQKLSEAAAIVTAVNNGRLSPPEMGTAYSAAKTQMLPPPPPGAWSVTAADAWSATNRQIRKSSMPELSRPDQQQWPENGSHSNEESRRNSQEDEQEFLAITAEYAAQHAGHQQQLPKLPMAARAPGHGRPANGSPVLGQSRLMALNALAAGGYPVDFQSLAEMTLEETPI